MLFSNSPVKKVVEKLNPFSQKNKVSRLKFERKSDYRTFLKFIKDNTKEIEDIDVSGEDKKRKGFMLGGAILGLGLLGSFGKGKLDSDDSAGKLKSITGVIEKAKADSRKAASGNKTRRDLKTGDDVLDSARRELAARRNAKRIRIDIVNQYRERANRKRRRIQKKYRPKSSTFSIKPTKKTEFAGVTGDTLDNNKKTRRGNRVTFAGSDDDIKIGFPSKKDIEGEKKLTKKKFKSDVEKITTPSSDDKKIEKSIVRNFNKKQNQNQQVFMDVDGTFKTNYDDLSPEAKKMDSNTKKLNKTLNQPGASRVNPYTRFNPTEPFMDDDLGQRTGKTTDKLELKPPKKLTKFDKFNRFSNRILNSPAAKFTTFFGGLLANPKFQIIKTLMEPTPLADGTLEGKPGVSVFSQQLMFDEDAAVNIFDFSEGRKSAIPFDANIKEPLVSQPSNLQAPINDVFIDFEFNTTEDLFFMKMGGS